MSGIDGQDNISTYGQYIFVLACGIFGIVSYQKHISFEEGRLSSKNEAAVERNRMKQETAERIEELIERSRKNEEKRYQEGYESGKSDENVKATAKMVKLREEIEAREATIDQLKNETALGVANLEYLREQHRKQYENQLQLVKESLEEKLEAKEREFETCRAEMQQAHELHLKSECLKVAKEKEEFAAQEFKRGVEQATVGKDMEIQSLLDQQLKQSNERDAEMADKLAKEHERQEQLESLIRQLRETLKQNQMKMERMENEFRHAKSLSQNEVYELQEQLETSVSTKERLQAELKHAQSQYQVGYDRGVETTQVSVTQMKADCLALVNDKVEAEMEQMKDEISHLTKKNADLENHKSSMAAMEKILNRDIKRLQARVEELKTNCDEEFKKGYAEATKAALSIKVPNEDEYEELRAENAELKHENENLREKKCDKCVELDQQVRQLEIDLHTVKQEARGNFERGKKENQIKLTMLEHEFQALQAKMKNRELTHADLIRQYMQLTQEKEDRQMQMYDRGFQEGLRASSGDGTDRTVRLKVPVTLNAASPEFVPTKSTKMDPETPEYIPASKYSSAISPMNPKSKPFVPNSDVLKRTMQCTDYEVRSTYRSSTAGDNNNAEEIKVVHSSYTVRQNNDNPIKPPGFIIPPRSKAIRFALGSDGPVTDLS